MTSTSHSTSAPSATVPDAPVLHLEHGALGDEELPPPPTPKAPRRLGRDILPPIGVFGVVIGLWYAWHFALPKYKQWILPLPHSILLHGFTEKDNPKNPVALLKGLWLTARVSLTGLLIAILIGVGLAVLMSQAKWVENSIYPYAIALQTVPILAITPILRALFGYGLGARTVVCVLIALFPIIINTLFGLLSADAGQHDLFTLHGANRLTRLVKLQFPAALPAMFEGFRIAAGASVIGAIVGEFFFRQGPKGLGILIDLYTSRLWGEQTYAALVLTSLLGLTFFWLFGLLRKSVIGRWYQVRR